jgi:hypothetical protein
MTDTTTTTRGNTMSETEPTTYTDTAEAAKKLTEAKTELKIAVEVLEDAQMEVGKAAAKRNEAVKFFATTVRSFLGDDTASMFSESDDDDWEPETDSDFCQICGGPNH